MSYTKYTFCSMNVVAAIILVFLIYHRRSAQAKLLNKLNKSVLTISIINLVFAFIPGLLADVYYNVSRGYPRSS